MNYAFSHQSKKQVVGIGIKTDNDKCLVDIPKLWDKFLSEDILNKITHKINNNILAIYSDYEGDFTKPFFYTIGCEVSLFEESEFIKKVIPSSDYAVFVAKGEFSKSIKDTWEKIWQSDVKRKYSFDFEVYKENFDPINNSDVEIFIAK